MSGCPVVSLLEASHCIRLLAFLSFDYVELDLIAIFECLVPIQLDCRVVDEYIPPVFASNESKTFGVVKPPNYSFVLSHTLLPFLHLGCRRIGQWDARTVICDEINRRSDS
jgi:hypothetical protein